MTIGDYLAVRMISDPLCLYDCDVPCDGSTAIVVSHRDYAPDAPAPAVGINAMGTAIRGRPSWDQFDDLTSMMMRHTAASMWERTELTPDDVDTAQLYDGFSWLTLAWIEAMGFCGKGESGSFIEGGANIAPDGPDASQHIGRPAVRGQPARLRPPARGGQCSCAAPPTSRLPVARWPRSVPVVGPRRAACCLPGVRRERWAARAAVVLGGVVTVEAGRLLPRETVSL